MIYEETVYVKIDVAPADLSRQNLWPTRRHNETDSRAASLSMPPANYKP